MSKMTIQRKRFCQYIVEGLNQTQAALKAGYKESSAKVMGSQLMSMDCIKEYIAELEGLNNKYEGSPAIEEDVDVAVLCRDPIQKLIELMNCKDDLIEMQAATKLLPYFYLKKSESGDNRIGKKELKEVTAIEATSKSKYSTLSNQLTNIYEHDKE